MFHNPVTCLTCNGVKMQCVVYVEVRQYGAIGIFQWRALPIEIESQAEADWREAAFNEAHQSGYETRGLTLSWAEAQRNRDFGTMFEGAVPIL